MDRIICRAGVYEWNIDGDFANIEPHRKYRHNSNNTISVFICSLPNQYSITKRQEILYMIAHYKLKKKWHYFYGVCSHCLGMCYVYDLHITVDAEVLSDYRHYNICNQCFDLSYDKHVRQSKWKIITLSTKSPIRAMIRSAAGEILFLYQFTTFVSNIEFNRHTLIYNNCSLCGDSTRYKLCDDCYIHMKKFYKYGNTYKYFLLTNIELIDDILNYIGQYFYLLTK